MWVGWDAIVNSVEILFVEGISQQKPGKKRRARYASNSGKVLEVGMSLVSKGPMRLERRGNKKSECWKIKGLGVGRPSRL